MTSNSNPEDHQPMIIINLPPSYYKFRDQIDKHLGIVFPIHFATSLLFIIILMTIPRLFSLGLPIFPGELLGVPTSFFIPFWRIPSYLLLIPPLILTSIFSDFLTAGVLYAVKHNQQLLRSFGKGLTRYGPKTVMIGLIFSTASLLQLYLASSGILSTQPLLGLFHPLISISPALLYYSWFHLVFTDCGIIKALKRSIHTYKVVPEMILVSGVYFIMYFFGTILAWAPFTYSTPDNPTLVMGINSFFIVFLGSLWSSIYIAIAIEAVHTYNARQEMTHIAQ